MHGAVWITKEILWVAIPVADVASTLLLYSSAVLVSAYLLWVANPSYSVAIMSSNKVVLTLSPTFVYHSMYPTR